MVGCYVTGILPRPKELIQVTRAYARKAINKKELEKAFNEATLKVVNAQVIHNFSYVTDGMLKWQDLLRPLTENLDGVKVGSLTRWFDNNTFYRKPLVINELSPKKSLLKGIVDVKFLPNNLPWKVILPAPYTFAKLAGNYFYANETKLMFAYAEVLKKEITKLVKLGFKYVQLSDPALVYKPFTASCSKDELKTVNDALKIAVKGLPVKTCLQTFFGDFAQILPDAFEFPVDHLGIDLYETDFEKLEEYSFEKGVALGLINSRSSLIENVNYLVKTATKLLNSIYRSKPKEIFICPNCDLEFLPWEKAEEKMRVVSAIANRIGDELCG